MYISEIHCKQFMPCLDDLEQPNCEKDDEQLTSVEELLAFIEGGDGEETEQSKLSKRQKKKLKKV